MPKLPIKDAIERSIDENNARLAGVVADAFRSRGFNYGQVLAVVQSFRPGVTADQWEALMYEADTMEASYG